MEAIEDLLGLARQGNAEALSTLYEHFLPGVFGYIALRVPDRAVAEDVTSEVFLRMVEGIHRLRAKDEAGCTAWLLRIARAAVADYYRKRARQPVVVPLVDETREEMQDAPPLVLFPHPDGDPISWMEAREDWQTVVKAINQLTEEQRQVLVGRLILGHDVATVAKMIGKKADAVKALQARALKSLRRLLGKQDTLEGAKKEVRR